MAEPPDFPLADAARLIRHKHALGDLHGAFRLIGLEVVSAATADGDLVEIDQLLSTFDEEDDELIDLMEDGLAGQGSTADRAPGRPATDEQARDLRQRYRSAARNRSMIASLLTPDTPSPVEEEPRITPTYESVPLGPRSHAPRQKVDLTEAWNVARRAFDLGLREPRPWKLDLRVSVELLARFEPLERLPKRTRWRIDHNVVVLADLTVTTGAFAADAAQLVEALKSMVGRRLFREMLSMRSGDEWLTGDGPVWTLSPLVIDGPPATYIVLAGGAHLPGGGYHSSWLSLATDLADDGHSVVLVWFGDDVDGWSSRRLPWISYLSL